MRVPKKMIRKTTFSAGNKTQFGELFFVLNIVTMRFRFFRSLAPLEGSVIFVVCCSWTLSRKCITVLYNGPALGLICYSLIINCDHSEAFRGLRLLIA